MFINLCACNEVVLKIFAGFGMFATRDLPAGAFIVDYHGELITAEEADIRLKQEEKKQRKTPNPRFYIFYFKKNGKTYA